MMKVTIQLEMDNVLHCKMSDGSYHKLFAAWCARGTPDAVHVVTFQSEQDGVWGELTLDLTRVVWMAGEMQRRPPLN